MPYLIYAYVSSVPITRAVLSRESSLGGSESAAMGLLEALAARGHDCHVFATRLSEDAEGDWRGVAWHPADTLGDTCAFAPPDVFLSLRMTDIFAQTTGARWSVLWAQDLLTDGAVAAQLAPVDEIAYVSAYHRRQWEGVQPLLAPVGWVTRNGIDARDVAVTGPAHRVRHRFIYTSRPERGLEPLLRMWPAIRAAIPDAELQIARYRSMYDGEGSDVAQMVARFDAMTEAVAQSVGGITVLGHLAKPDLYKALASARLLLYPGVADFAETNGIAVTEAQACGTPVVASWRGALPETLHRDAGILLDGDALTPDYQARFVAEVVRLAEEDEAWGAMSRAGRAWALPRSDHATLADEWEAHWGERFAVRHAASKPAVLRALLWWDQHAQARAVAAEIGDADALALCERVIRQEAHTPEDYARYAVADGEAEMAHNTRLRRAADLIAADHPASVLDFACGNGAMLGLLADALPDAAIVGYDYAPQLVQRANELLARRGAAPSVRAVCGSLDDVTGRYDVVFCGEYLEHTAEPWAVLDRLEAFCAPTGRVVLTVPCGPFVELLEAHVPRQRSHVRTFTLRDLTTLTRHKIDPTLEYLPAGISPRGTPVGFWLITFRPGGGPAVPLDDRHAIETTRPAVRLTASLIVKDGADTLRRCLRSIRPVVDRIVVLDTGSTDGSQAIARAEGAEVVEQPWPGDFASARNAALDLVEADAEWVLWIDADEELIGGERLRHYLTAGHPFHGFVIPQQHLMADQPTFSDHPIRLFRAGRGVRFYGLVHEQPEERPDAGIWPAMELPDVRIVHDGYRTDRVRRQKLLSRNLDLLLTELARPDARQLAHVLAIRDEVNLALFARESAGGVLTREARRGLLHAVARYQAHFADPAHRYHALARPFYEAALDQLHQGWQVQWLFRAGKTLAGVRRPETFRVLSAAEAKAEIDHDLARWLAEMTGPVLDCAPWVTRNGDGGWGLAAHTADAAEENHAGAR